MIKQKPLKALLATAFLSASTLTPFATSASVNIIGSGDLFATSNPAFTDNHGLIYLGAYATTAGAAATITGVDVHGFAASLSVNNGAAIQLGSIYDLGSGAGSYNITVANGSSVTLTGVSTIAGGYQNKYDKLKAITIAGGGTVNITPTNVGNIDFSNVSLYTTDNSNGGGSLNIYALPGNGPLAGGTLTFGGTLGANGNIATATAIKILAGGGVDGGGAAGGGVGTDVSINAINTLSDISIFSGAGGNVGAGVFTDGSNGGSVSISSYTKGGKINISTSNAGSGSAAAAGTAGDSGAVTINGVVIASSAGSTFQTGNGGGAMLPGGVPSTGGVSGSIVINSTINSNGTLNLKTSDAGSCNGAAMGGNSGSITSPGIMTINSGGNIVVTLGNNGMPGTAAISPSGGNINLLGGVTFNGGGTIQITNTAGNYGAGTLVIKGNLTSDGASVLDFNGKDQNVLFDSTSSALSINKAIIVGVAGRGQVSTNAASGNNITFAGLVGESAAVRLGTLAIDGDLSAKTIFSSGVYANTITINAPAEFDSVVNAGSLTFNANTVMYMGSNMSIEMMANINAVPAGAKIMTVSGQGPQFTFNTNINTSPSPLTLGATDTNQTLTVTNAHLESSTINIDGLGTVLIDTTVTVPIAIHYNFVNNGTLINNGPDAPINNITALDYQGTVIIPDSNVTLNGPIGDTRPINSLVLNASGANTMTVSGLLNTGSLIVNGNGGTVLGGNFNIQTAKFAADGTLTINTNGILNAIDNVSSGVVGTLLLQKSLSIGQSIGQTRQVKLVRLKGYNLTLGTTAAIQTLDFTSGGSLTIPNGASLNYQSFANPVVGSQITMTGASSITSTGKLGVTLPLINAGSNGAISTFSGNIDVAYIQGAGTGTIYLKQANISGGINTSGGSPAVIKMGGSNIGSVGSVGNPVGIISVDAGNSKISSSLYASGINYISPAGSLNISGAGQINNITGGITTTGGGTLIVGSGSLGCDIGTQVAALTSLQITTGSTLLSNSKNIYASSIVPAGSGSGTALNLNGGTVGGVAGSSSNPFANILLNNFTVSQDMYAGLFNVSGNVTLNAALYGPIVLAASSSLDATRGALNGAVTGSGSLIIGQAAINNAIGASGSNLAGVILTPAAHSLGNDIYANTVTGDNASLSLNKSVQVYNLSAQNLNLITNGNSLGLPNGGSLGGNFVLNLEVNSASSTAPALNVTGGSLHISNMTVNVTNNYGGSTLTLINGSNDYKGIPTVNTFTSSGSTNLITWTYDNSTGILNGAVNKTAVQDAQNAVQSNVPSADPKLLGVIFDSTNTGDAFVAETLLANATPEQAQEIVSQIQGLTKEVEAQAITANTGTLDNISSIISQQVIDYFSDLSIPEAEPSGPPSSPPSTSTFIPDSSRDTGASNSSNSDSSAKKDSDSEMDAGVGAGESEEDKSRRVWISTAKTGKSDVFEGPGRSKFKLLDASWSFFGGKARQGIIKGAAGSRTKTYGTSIGIDTRLAERWMAGLALTYTENTTAMDNALKGSTYYSSGWVVTTYGLYSATNQWSIRAGLSYGKTQNINNSYRLVTLPNTHKIAYAKYYSRFISPDISTSYRFTLPHNITFVPSVGMQYIYSLSDPYQESGARPLNMIVKKRAEKGVLSGNIGLSLSTFFKIDDLLIKPEVHGSFRRTAFRASRNPTTLSKLDGGSQFYVTRTHPTKKVTYSVGTSVTITLGKSLDIGVGYDASLGEKYLAHRGSLRMRVSF